MHKSGGYFRSSYKKITPVGQTAEEKITKSQKKVPRVQNSFSECMLQRFKHKCFQG